ncbi:MAG: VWA domain-containing protein [Planctomycetota bacterium]
MSWEAARGTMELLVPFRHREVLFLLVIPALLLFWTWKRKGRSVVLPFDFSRSSRGSWLRGVVGSAESLAPLLLAVVIFILAGPQRWDEPRAKKVLTNIEFCVDVSGSMTASFGEGTRYDASLQAINDFLNYREGDAFGLTFFGNSVLHWVPLTTDVSAFRCAPPFMRPENLPSWFGGTEIGKALLECRKVLLEREEGDRMIILVSDGQSWDLSGGKDAEVARRLVADHIVVYAVHIGESEPPREIVTITATTGGEVFDAGDPAGLDHVFKAIDAMQVTRMEKARAEAVDDYDLLCRLGLGTVALLLLTLFGLRYTPW